MFKRIVYVIGFFPYSIYLGLRWIVTGKSALDGIDEFERWADDK